MESLDPQLIAPNKNEANVAYRVTGIPIDYKQKQVKAILQTALQLDKAGNSVKLRSIAISPNRKTKVATVCFSCRPILLPPRADGEWHFPIPTENNSGYSSADDDDDIIPQEQIITVDSHFKGITVLRSFSKLDDHKIDIIAISGLGGHAFGSFKARDGQHMWLCDSLPRDLPGAQIMIYGYDTQLHGSASFQDIESLASSLRASIAAQRTSGSTNAKPKTVPLIFIAHSLGGLIVKEAMIQMKNDKKHQDILESIYGGLFFGVPSQGMEITSLVPMVAGQLNQALLHTLGKESQLLRNQFRDFPKAFDSKDSEIFCYYETEMSRTAKLAENNVWKMEGPLGILVDSSSARHTRPWENEAHNCIGMKRDHSTLVKFSPNDSDYDEVLTKLNRMTLTAVSTIPRGIRGQLKLKEFTEDEKGAIEDSLKFDRMQTRFFDVETPTSTTCDWLFSTPEYDQWLDSNLISEHHGFIWIKGKPGSGKSTIMKHAVEAATNTAPLSIIITFFFNARGSTELEKSILGMYRSVLFQIISKIPTILDDLLHLFSSKIKYGKVYEWNIGELQAILIMIMTRPQKYSLMWFIDALDECKDDEVLKLVKFFENIGHTAVSSGISLHICLSTRHYPNIPIRWGIQLTLETQQGHDQDIMAYINSEFRAPHNPHVASILSELRSRSSGVFIWVILVVELLNTAFRRGERQLQQILDSVPKELDDLFTNILKEDPSSKDQSILCFQWLLFSRRPLNPEELYFAVLAGTEPKTIGKWDADEINSEGIGNFTLHISKGLLEVSKTQGTVQFIHESVRDFFLLHDGFTKLEPNLATNVEGFSEERLKHCCYQYMVLGVFKDSYCSPGQLRPTPPLYREKKDPSLEQDILRQFPFARYAVRYVFAHADVAQRCDINQGEFLTNFESPDKTLIQKWVMLHNDLNCPQDGLATYDYDSNDSLIYILSDQNLPDLLLISIHNRGNVNAIGKHHGSPLQLAATRGYLTIAKLLIAAGADMDFARDKFESSPLFSALHYGHLDIVQLLLENGARHDFVDPFSQTPLILAAERQSIAVVQKLLQLGANVNAEGGGALHAAVQSRNEQIVQLLLQSGADVNLERGQRGSALHVAAFYGDCQMVQLLLQSGADVNSVGGSFYGNALDAAAYSGVVQIVQLLLHSGAKVNIIQTKEGSALLTAAKNGNEQMVRLLVDAGADLNRRGGIRYINALQMAASGGYEQMVQLLLDAGADVNIGGGDYHGDALQMAVSNGHEQVVRLLLHAGANARSEASGYYGSALQEAAGHGNEKLVRLLLHAGADVNGMGGCSGSALQAAAMGGHEQVVQLLLHAGADVNRMARRTDVNRMGRRTGSALQEAVKRGDSGIAQLLRLHGAKEVEI
ncbi:hypothetical protein V502_10733 [Pseudogymnoascus sp. VKM F-4520 (FW-2644)]|nr:hypothetical protein V502_10733 [Pseudogymnoascus sp. VKM F-4520 (FW-2644)]